MKIAIIGNIDIIKGFGALGVDLFGVQTRTEAKEALNLIYSQDSYGLVFIAEKWLAELKRGEKDEFKERALPAIISIPELGDKKSGLAQDLDQIIERAIGSNMFLK